MATTIPSAFDILRDRLEITDLQAETVSTRQSSVRDAVAAEMQIANSFLTGSYQRNTMIAPLKEADIDIFTVLGSDHHHYHSEANGHTNLLEAVKRVLLKRYPSTPKVSRSGQAVSITFTDFVVDVVPAFNRQGGGYLIPSTTAGRWIETDPTVHVRLSAELNKAQNWKFVPLVKMIKAWNRNINHGFRSFYLELLARQILLNVTITDYPSGIRYFFDKGRELIPYIIKDPAFGDPVQGFDTVGTSEDAISRFTTAYNRALKAEEYAEKGYIADAIGEWRKILGDYFPTYG